MESNKAEKQPADAATDTFWNKTIKHDAPILEVTLRTFKQSSAIVAQQGRVRMSDSCEPSRAMATSALQVRQF
jgi:hypothetical protein